jgi:hypothetical protein
MAENWTSVPQGPFPPGLNLKDPTYPEAIRLPSIIKDWRALESTKQQPAAKDPFLARLRSGSRKPLVLEKDQQSKTGSTGVLSGNFGGGVDANDPNKLPVNHVLLRFIDTDLQPGLTYQYRVKVRLRNPNFGKPELVADTTLAEKEFLESAPYELKNNLTVPPESFMYAYSPKEYESKAMSQISPYQTANSNRTLNSYAASLLAKLLDLADVKESDPLAGKKAVIQVQRWVPQVLLGDAIEPIGGWVQAEIPVGIGEYIGEKVLVELPLWRAAEGQFTLSSPSKPLIAGFPKPSTGVTQPLGRAVDFSTQHVLLDFLGGKVAERPTPTGSLVTDEAQTELLILRDDGRIQVRREIDDSQQRERKNRESTWEKWVSTVKKQTPSSTNAPGAPGGFQPGRGGGGPDDQ